MTNRRQFLRGVAGGGITSLILALMRDNFVGAEEAPAQAAEPTAGFQVPYYWTDPDGTEFAVEALAKCRDSDDFYVRAYHFPRNIYYGERREYPRMQMLARGWSAQDILDDLKSFARGEFRDDYYRDRLKEYGF